MAVPQTAPALFVPISVAGARAGEGGKQRWQQNQATAAHDGIHKTGRAAEASVTTIRFHGPDCRTQFCYGLESG